ncbi:Bys1 family protein, partial [Aspergillus ruber CBS 135680]
TAAHPFVFPNTTNTTGGHAIIRNSCAYPLYLWSVGASISPQYTLPAYHSYREPFRHDAVSGGVALKVTTAPNGLFTGKPQTIFAYNLNVNASSVWYDLSDVFGDPFEGSKVKVGVVSGRGGKTSVEEGLRWEDGVPPRGSQVRVAGAREDLSVEFC